MSEGRGQDNTQQPSADARTDTVRGEQRELVSLMTARVGEAYLRQPFFVDGDTDVVSLCRMLDERGVGEALVRDGDRLGIFTTTNLRDALLRPEPPAQLAVRDLATFAPVSVSVNDELHEALILMLRHRIHRVIVRDGDAVVGVLSQLDLMGFVAGHSHLITLQAASAQDVPALAAAATQVDGLIRLLHQDGVRPSVIAGLVGELNRQVFRRLWTLLAPAELRSNSCLVVMGSEGRGEQIVKTDQDNALILRDGFEHPRLGEVTAAFSAALGELGYPPCPGGIMLSRPLWCQPLAGFKKSLRDWVHGSDPVGPMNLAIFLDAAAVDGDESLLQAARDHVDHLVQDSGLWFARFTRAVEQFDDGDSWWTRLPGLKGTRPTRIDIKKVGLFPIVHGVRALALQHRIRAPGTVDRIRALEAEGRIEAPMARDLAEALQFLIGLKLTTNLRQLAEGREPGNEVRLDALGRLERQTLRDSIAIVRGFRQWLGRRFRFDTL
ncbi:putative nucleotidyltransferase substrate binding domain-containing protein [Luteimonas sp. A277]